MTAVGGGGTLASSPAGAAGAATSAATPPSGAAVGDVTGGATGGAATGGVTSGAAIGGAASSATATGRIDSSVATPDQPRPPSVETEVSRAAGRDANVTLRGGGAGVVEREVGPTGDAELEQEVVAKSREGQRGVSDMKYGAGEAQFSATAGPTSGLGRAENFEIRERDQVVARSQEAEDAQAAARRVANDPGAVGTERAEMAASQRAAETLPVDPRRAEAQANVVTGAVDDPRGAAQAQAESAAEAQAREVQGEAQVEVGVRGPGGQSHEEIVGKPPTGGEKK